MSLGQQGNYKNLESRIEPTTGLKMSQKGLQLTSHITWTENHQSLNEAQKNMMTFERVTVGSKNKKQF